MNSDHSRRSSDKPPGAHDQFAVEVRAAEGLRLIAAFTQIRQQTHRSTVIDLAEKLAN